MTRWSSKIGLVAATCCLLASTIPARAWERKLGSDWSYVRAATADAGDGILIAGYSENVERPDGMGLLTRYSSNGRELATYAVNTRYGSWATHVAPRRGGGYYLLTSGRTHQGGDGEVVIARIDPSLGLLWGRLITGAEIVSYLGIAPDANGGLWVHTQSDTVFRIDEDGTLGWQGEIDAPGDRMAWLDVLPNGDVVLGGEGTLLRMAPDGSIVWARQHEHYIRRVAAGEDGRIAVYSESRDGTNTRHVLMLDGDGVPIWTRNFEFVDRTLVGWNLDVDAAGRVTVAGYFRDDPDQADPWILRLSADGVPEWELALPDASDYTDVWTIASDGDRLFVAGRNGVPGRIDWGAWLMVVDETGDPDSPCRPWENWDTPTTTIPVAVTAGDAQILPTGLAIRAHEVSLEPLPSLAVPMGGDSYEEDDTCAEGIEWSPTRAGRTQARDFCDDADDWLTLAARAGETYTVETTPVDLSLDTIVEVHDAACGTLLWSDDNSGFLNGSRLSFTPAAHGDYRIRIRTADGSSGAGRVYRLALSGEPRQGAPWTRVGLQARGVASSRAGHLVTVDGERFSLLDEGGVPIWTKGLEDVRLARVAVAPDCSFALTGSRRGFGFWLGTFDPDGSPNWQLRSESDADAVAIGLSVTPEGHWLVGAEQDGLPMVAEIDADGSPLWQARLDHPHAYDLSFTATLEDGTRVLQSDERVFGFDPAGALLWTFEMPSLHAAGLVPLSDGSLIALGSTATWQQPGGSSAAFRLRPPAGVDWARRYAAGSEVFFASGRELPSDRVVVVGRQRETADGPSRPLLLILDAATGSATLSRGFDTEDPVGAFLDVAASPEELLLAGGEAPLVLTDGLASVGMGCSPPLDVSLTVDDWPGPASYGSAPPLLPEVALVPVNQALRSADQGASLLCRSEALPPLEVSPPGSPEPLLVERHDQISWEAASVSGAERFHLYRFDLDERGPGGDCSSVPCAPLVLTENVHVDPETPGLDRGWAYLVAGVVTDEEGPLGRDSTGSLRPVPLSCP